MTLQINDLMSYAKEIGLKNILVTIEDDGDGYKYYCVKDKNTTLTKTQLYEGVLCFLDFYKLSKD